MFKFQVRRATTVVVMPRSSFEYLNESKFAASTRNVRCQFTCRTLEPQHTQWQLAWFPFVLLFHSFLFSLICVGRAEPNTTRLMCICNQFSVKSKPNCAAPASRLIYNCRSAYIEVDKWWWRWDDTFRTHTHTRVRAGLAQRSQQQQKWLSFSNVLTIQRYPYVRFIGIYALNCGECCCAFNSRIWIGGTATNTTNNIIIGTKKIKKKVKEEEEEDVAKTQSQNNRTSHASRHMTMSSRSPWPRLPLTRIHSLTHSL